MRCARCRPPRQLLSQLNQVVLPAVERLHTGAEGDGSGLLGGVKDDEGEDGEEEDDDDDDDDEETPSKRRR